MGATTSSPHDNKPKLTDKYRETYTLLTRQTGFIAERFDTYFIQISGFSRNLYTFFSKFKIHSYQTFSEIISILTRYQPQITLNREYQPLIEKTSIFDRFAMIALGVFDPAQYLSRKSDHKEKIGLITKYFQIFTRNIDEKDVVKAFEFLEKGAKETDSTKLFLEGWREVFPFAQQHLVTYYKGKFQSVTKEYFGIVDPKSTMLSVEDWIILSMKAPKIKQNTPTLLYSDSIHGTSFSSFESQIIGYSGPWMLVLQHTEQDIETKQKTKYVIGSYQTTPLKDVHTYQGSPECFLFRISPNIKYLVPQNGEGESNYFYMFNMQNVKSRRRGLGFGGKDFQNFKLWIDEDIEDKSYVHNGADMTYGYGYIASPGTEKLKVHKLEVWGLGNEQNLQDQKQYKRTKVQQATRRRKVNKQELLSGGIATELIFQKNFAHRDQVQGQIPGRDNQK